MLLSLEVYVTFNNMKTNDRLKPSCPGATLLQGRMLNGSLSEASLKKWVEDLNLEK